MPRHLQRTLPRPTMSMIARLAALAGTGVILAGCQQYFVDRGYYARKDAISYQAGDAVASNRAIHTIDPWPARSGDTDIPYSAKRAAKAIENYESYPRDTATSASPGSQAIIIAPTGTIK